MTPAAPPVAARASLRRTYASAELAQALARSLSPDDQGFLRCHVRGRALEIEARASSVGELQRTLDDALACLSAAERTWQSVHGGGTPRPPVEDDEERDE